MYSNFKKSTSIVAPFYSWDLDLKLFKFHLHGDDSIQVTAFFGQSVSQMKSLKEIFVFVSM